MSSIFLWSLFTSMGHAPRPNIVFILADDLGWDDVGWTNFDMKTPNLNTLAEEGIILNSSYATPLCSPSRAALLTGIYPFKLGMQHGALKKDAPQGLPLNVTILPQHLKELGYSTHLIGKWHLGYCNWKYTPTYRGFDSFFGFYQGSQDYYTHKAAGGYDFRYNTKPYFPTKVKYSTTEYAQHARDIIKYHDTRKPLFMFLSLQAVHVPNMVPRRYEKLFSHVPNRNRRVYSGMVAAMDDAVGEVMRALHSKGMVDNTLIIFTSDNGGAPLQGGSNWPLRGGKGAIYEGGTRVPTLVWGHMLNKTAYVNNDLFHMTDWFPTIMEAAGGKPDKTRDGRSQWKVLAHGHKSHKREFVYGINEVMGKAAIRVRKYKLIEGYPGMYDEWYKQPKTKSRRNQTLRKVRHKQIEAKARKHMNYTQLYNVHRDPAERVNLASKHPDIVESLKSKLAGYRKQLVPAQNPAPVAKADPKFWRGIWSPGWC